MEKIWKIIISVKNNWTSTTYTQALIKPKKVEMKQVTHSHLKFYVSKFESICGGW